MLVSRLIEELKKLPQDEVIVISDEAGGWDNIVEVKSSPSATIVFGGGSPFSDE